MDDKDIEYRRNALTMTDEEFEELYRFLDTAKTLEEREQFREQFYREHNLKRPTMLDRWQADADSYSE